MAERERSYPPPPPEHPLAAGMVMITVLELRDYRAAVAQLNGVKIAMARWLGAECAPDAGEYHQGFTDGVHAPLRDIQRALGTHLDTGRQARKP